MQFEGPASSGYLHPEGEQTDSNRVTRLTLRDALLFERILQDLKSAPNDALIEATLRCVREVANDEFP